MPQQNNSYRNYYGRNYGRMTGNFTKEEIRQVIESGDPEAIRELSKYYNRFSGTYTRPSLQWMSSPVRKCPWAFGLNFAAQSVRN